MKLTTGREIPDELLGDLVDHTIISYASYGFEDFNSASDDVIQSLQENVWEGIEGTLTYEEAMEIWNIIEQPVKCFSNELAEAYSNLKMKYIGTKSWEV